MAKIDVKCRYCNKTEEVVKAGYSISKQQRYQCKQCNRYFQLEYINNASKPGVKEQIVEMAINGSGVRDTVRVLKVGINTVTRVLKKSSIKNNKSFYHNTTEVIIAPEIDEQCSYVQNKSKQRWLWYALDKISLKVVAYTFGTRCDSTLESLLKKLDGFKVTFYFTDGWGRYTRLLDPKKHIVSKKYTQRIERTNLNLRTRCKRLARKTICFSKSLDIHDKVIGTLIELIAF